MNSTIVVSPAAAPEQGYFFDEEAIRALRRIDFLRTNCGVNLAGTRLILELAHELERLQAEVRCLRK